jgi:2'-5' RNA ligase
MVFEIAQRGNVEFFGSILPSHVSVKQAFAFESLPRLESWFDSLAQRIAPFDMTLDDIYYTEWSGFGVVGINVVDAPNLRGLHEQINRELVSVVKDPTAPHDGNDYHFHLTVEMSRLGGTNPLNAYHDALTNRKTDITFRAEELAMFLVADRPLAPGSVILYRVMPLGRPSSD